MNTLRIWGGGLFFYDAFYDACDELGLLILHDLMFIEQVNTDRLQIIRCFSLGCVCHTDGTVTQGHGPCCPFYGAASGWSNAGHAYNVSCTCEGEAAATQKAELLHQLRRLSAHPSIAVCECSVFFGLCACVWLE